MRNPGKHKGRGACSSPAPRFRSVRHEAVDDGWWQDEAPAPQTVVMPDPARTVISRNQSPDVPFDRSINPYRGCEHGCIYCFARPSHAYLDLSPGLDFETRLFAKLEAADRLKEELARPSYRCAPIVLGANTDAYQPVEKDYRISRGILEVLADCRHPVSILTKSGLILRDLDILVPMARRGLVNVMVSVTTLDSELKRRLEPRTPSGERRLAVVRRLNEAGVPTGILLAPVIPAINDPELETIVAESAAAGAVCVGSVILRLPHELSQLFREWLQAHYPDRAGRVMKILQSMRGGRDNDSDFGRRMRGQGPFADLIARRMQLARRRVGLYRREQVSLDCGQFRHPEVSGSQISLL